MKTLTKYFSIRGRYSRGVAKLGLFLTKKVLTNLKAVPLLKD
jgi:hypothetical protein